MVRQTAPWTCHWIQEASWLLEDLLYKDQNFWIREDNHEKVNKQFWFTNSKIVFQGERFLQTKRQTFSVKKCFWNYTAEPYDCLTKSVVQIPFCVYKMKYLEGQTHLEELSISRRDFPQEGVFSTNTDITRGRVIWHGLPETSFHTFAFVFLFTSSFCICPLAMIFEKLICTIFIMFRQWEEPLPEYFLPVLTWSTRT